MTRVCIFVDGENFRHSIGGLFKDEFQRADYLPKRADWTRLFDHIASASSHLGMRIRTYWYVVQGIEFYPYGLRKLAKRPKTLYSVLSKHPCFRAQLDQIAEAESRMDRMLEFVGNLEARQEGLQRRFEGWTRIQEQIATHHDAIEFRRSGIVRYDLLERKFRGEKSVDVKLACDMAFLKDVYDVAVIVSGDQDYVPAVELIKDYGKRVVNVAFKERSGKLRPGRARRLIQATDTSIILDYDVLSGYLGIEGRS